jgi:hypothetical protein
MAKKAGTGKPRGKKAAAALANENFAKMKEKLGSSKARPYRMSESFPVDCAIEHPKFGVGFVMSSSAQKIEVAFEDSNRALVQNRK